MLKWFRSLTLAIRFYAVSLFSLFANFHDHKEHWVARWLYFFFFCGVGAFAMFLNVYYRSIDLSCTQIGVISMLGPAVGIFSATFWGMLRDRSGKMRLLFSLTILGSLIWVLIFSRVQVFLWLIPVVALFNFFYTPILPLIDSNTLRLLGARGQRFGRYRVWGTVSFTVASLVFGFVYERYGLHSMFTVYPLCSDVLLWVGSGLVNQPVREQSLLDTVSRDGAASGWSLQASFLGLGANGTIAFVSVKYGDGRVGGPGGIIWTTTAIGNSAHVYSEPLLRRLL
jgi:MFS family permease